METKTRHLIMKLAEQYEKPEFVADDPVQFPRKFGYKCSQEIVGFIAAWLAYGNRKAILSTCEKLCKEMERLTPYMYIKNMGWRKYIDSEEPLYRFFKEKDFADLCRALKEIYDNNEDMEEALSKNYTRTMGATDYLDALITLFPGVKGIPQDSKSVCKRLNMFLRWMCRRNSPVDLGIWSFIPQSSLLIPLDTHVATVGRQLGLITGKGDSMNTVLELTTNCRNVYPLDPCKCDYALFGHGVNNKVMKATVESVLLNTSSRSVEIFAEILNAITSCKNESELREGMKSIQEEYTSFNSRFIYGFGSTHMWVTEPGRKERLIFVEF